ncbi:TPA: cyclic di-GMP phosphodiesterase [Klebsiella quasipneumoniae]|uniref:cyclic di-GMP phosphodiesterase n=1 Tax=Klebsiella quasipneumoniae TaxID=1463165 RepID=UPI0021D7E461|nr:cyclic di-GMP phosphodiesterase [Klebsiella quasipneumoniae]MCU8743667.1 cyclic di-GMP phosphodiesterase [Klebsiella quasipneumoniae]HBV2212806.1 cyclic di-GMP phosphodiesterase [Klebsiella quasipneumoniae]HCT3766991.1 cyclic di-GMP phosphodiesterase [Klebsiella quasipneumoniae]
MLTRYFSPQRKTWITSLCVGVIVALLAGSIQFMVIYHNRAERFDAIINNVNTYLKSYFHDLRQTINGLQPLVDQPCENIDSGLTSHAAFSPNVRAFLLVKNGVAFCSSATGAMDTPLTQLIPAIDIRKPLDMAILPGTPMMPKSAALALWVGKPGDKNSGIFVSINANLTPYILYSARQNDFSGIALAIDHTAISTFSNRLVDPQTLHNAPIRQIQIEGLPLKVYLYANSWLAENTQFALLLGVVCGLLAGLLCYYVLTIKSDPRKSILLGIKNNQFYVVYQPVVNAQTLHISGVEVLMRWRHPVVGEIPPDIFINLAETQQMIVPLTHHLLALIARDAAVLKRILPRGVKLGLNISPAHLQADSFRDDMLRFAAALPAGYFHVVLEVTERAMIDKEKSMANFAWLHRQGFEIAIDDFGTGHSALIYLERYNFDYLKIDRGFVQAIGTETVTSPVLDAVLTLSRRLKLMTVAEGVETQEQAEWLRAQGVHFLQGYWISRPLSLAALVAAHDEPANYFTTR